MKTIQMLLLLIIVFSIKALSHSGGTDSRGCHGGTEPYHCHNGSNSNSSTKKTDEDSSLSAYDLNIGYQYHIKDTPFIPYAGLSLGSDEIEKGHDIFDEYDIGVNLGFKFQNGWYMDYTTTSKSIKLGYRFLHLSFRPSFLGFGVRFPFHHNSDTSNQSIIYFSGTGFK